MWAVVVVCSICLPAYTKQNGDDDIGPLEVAPTVEPTRAAVSDVPQWLATIAPTNSRVSVEHSALTILKMMSAVSLAPVHPCDEKKVPRCGTAPGATCIKAGSDFRCACQKDWLCNTHCAAPHKRKPTCTWAKAERMYHCRNSYIYMIYRRSKGIYI